MNTFVDSADADQFSIEPCGPNCICAEDVPDEPDEPFVQIDQIVRDCQDCNCEDCQEILLVARSSYSQGFLDGIALSQTEERLKIDIATSEAVKSALDTVRFAPLFEFAFAPAITDEDVPPVNRVNRPDLFEHEDFDFFPEEDDALHRQIETLFSESEEEFEPEDLSLDHLARAFDSLYDQSAKVVVSIGELIGALQADVLKLSDLQDADAAYLEAIGDRLLAVEAALVQLRI